MSKLQTFKSINLMHWIQENKDLLRPPVNNKMIWEDSQFIAMIVGGPNKRRDFHVNPSDEFFYQIKGNAYIECITAEGEREVVTVEEGDVFMLPAMVPHSPHRVADSYGLVIERKRNADEQEDMVWYCDKCNHELHRVRSRVENIETQIKTAIEEFNSNQDLRTCRQCGHTLPAEVEAWQCE